MPLNVLHEALLKLQAGYEATHHGLRLQEVAEGYQFRTKATYSKYVQDLFKVNALVLTPSVLEVLAIIAYKQPVSKPEIDKIRGVDSAHLIRTLMEKHLVKIVGRSEDLGHPSLYGTTHEFLEVFNLSTLESLPPEHELTDLAKSSDVGKIADIRQICSGGDKKRFVFDELAELDQLSESIKNIVSETDFTRNLASEEKKRIAGQNPEVK
ncbi:MAG: SMC-Scp complex subunit ScpB, partial [Bdellovibrionota bacterium]